ncbi:Os11g0522000, partial [Oryza sativa Japonica Group]
FLYICIPLFTFSFDWSSALQFVTSGNVNLQELDFPEEQIQVSDALTEMSQGQWEGCPKSEVYTPEMVNLMDSTQPDFSAPAGESLRQVQFRMMEFLNQTVVRLPEKVAMGDSLSQQNEAKGLSRQSSTNSVQDGPPWDLLYRLNRHSLQRKKSGKSRLQFVTSGDNETEDDFSPKEINQRHILHEANLAPSVTSIAIFSHATPIRCLVAGVLDCNPMISQRICIEDSSITVLEHSLKTGWQIKRLNDTAHLRLL